jgi:hypothetical protein
MARFIFLFGGKIQIFEIVGSLENLPVGFQKLSNRLDFHFPNVKCVMGEQISVFFGNLFNFGQTLEKFSILAIVKRAKELLDFRTLMQNF